jgi:hypothetical protein
MTTEIITSYQLGIRREVINALRETFNTYPDTQFFTPEFKSRVFIGTEFPIKETQYPSIYVTYSEGIVKNAGIGNFEMQTMEDLTVQKVLHWRFEGAVNFNIFAKTSMDREMLSAGVLNILAFGKEIPEFKIFWDEIYDADWVVMQMIGDNPRPTGDSTEIAPWSQTETVYTRGYQVAVMGDFYTNPLAGGLIRISDIDMFPYRYDQPVPSGDQTPPNNTVPWEP